MKNIIYSLFLFLLFTNLAKGQDITGQWLGTLNVQGMKLRLVFNIQQKDSAYKATMDSPDQGVKGLPVTAVEFKNTFLKISVAAAQINYEGTLENDKITGTFKQGGLSLPLNLSKNLEEQAKINRPQEPKKPYPYYSEELVFTNKKENITLAGTLTLPTKEGKYPVVVLISGSGPQNRDCEIVGHKSFLLIADYLTKRGIGVLRYDDRGVAESKGIFSAATSQDFATDVEAAVSYLKTRNDINPKKIGLIGHSEGGLIAPMVAAKSKDVSFIVLLAGVGVNGGDVLLTQQRAISEGMGLNQKAIDLNYGINKKAYDLIKKSQNADNLKKELTDYFEKTIKETPYAKPPQMSEVDYVKAQVTANSNVWLQYFIRFDPANTLKNVKCPVLALNGDKDLQVSSKINLKAIEEALKKAKNKRVTIKEMPNLNHLFQECKTGLTIEYGEIEQTFSPTALNEMGVWLENIVK
jgi:uncharacterized protein